MTQWLKQSTAVTVKIGPFLDETDGKTAETGLTISQGDVRLSMNGGNMAQKNQADAATHDEIGWYDCSLDTTDTGTLGRLVLMVHESGALPVWHEYMIVPANVWDSMFGADYLQVDIKEISGDSTAADNLETACDGGTYNVGGGAVVAASVASGGITAASIATDAIDADALAANAVDEILDEVVEGTVTLRQALRLLLSFVGAKVSGGGTTEIIFRDIGDTKPRITMTVDADGDRSAVTLDGA